MTAPPAPSDQDPREGRSRVRLLGYNPAFDGLRGMAVLAVLAYHFRPFGAARGGWIGVDVFFALSGFLITTLLLNELALTGRVSLGRFHVRRALRLQPALWLFLASWLVAAMVLGRYYWFSTVPGFPVGHGAPLAPWVAVRGVIGTVAQIYNWMAIGHHSMPPIGHVWSLAIEEQFYLVWPVLLLLVVRLRPQAMLRLTGLMTVASSAACLVLAQAGVTDGRAYFGTDTRAQALLLGALVAQLYATGRFDSWAPRLTAKLLFGGAAVGIALITLLVDDHSRFRDLGGFSLIDLASAVVVAGLASGVSSRASRLLSHPVIVWVGKRSYAIYLWNYVIATWLHPLGTIGFVPGLAASLGMAELSWRLVERRALSLKGRFGRRPEPAAAAAPPRSPAVAPAG
ncbi:MAG TPA: acyltransferase [Acidimicrobiales bacterium]|nr:acyltransferase [Acidimicrobiales bacterium]